MMHRAWSSIEEVPYCFSRSSIKFQGHIALKIVEFDPNWAFPDCNSSLNSPMAMKCCTKLETAKKRCPIVFQGHPSNSKVTRDKTSRILTQIGRFRTIGRSQLSNPSDLPCYETTRPTDHFMGIVHNNHLIITFDKCGLWYDYIVQPKNRVLNCCYDRLPPRNYPNTIQLRHTIRSEYGKNSRCIRCLYNWHQLCITSYQIS